MLAGDTSVAQQNGLDRRVQGDVADRSREVEVLRKSCCLLRNVGVKGCLAVENLEPAICVWVVGRVAGWQG